jgi:protein-disulfide isomerase/uncharacterized membrane protein
VIAIFSIFGVIVAGISLYHHTAQRFGLQTEPSFCNINSRINCDAVNGSPFSMILGVPVASWGIVFYLMFLFAALVGLGRDLISQRTLASVLALFGLFSLAFSIYLFCVSEFVIGSVCLLCLGLYLINIVLFLCAWKLWPGGDSSGRLGAGLRNIISFPLCFFGGSPRWTSLAWITILVGALSLFCALAAPDLMLPYIVSKSQAKVEEQASKGIQDWASQKKVEISIKDGGALERDYHLGSASAPVQIVEFSDYECPACRTFAPVIDQIVHNYGNQVHFVSKNFPLDRSCNPTIEREMHRYACLAASFARCAGEQDRFWEAHNLLFGLEVLESGKSTEQVRAAMNQAGQALGLDISALDECIKSERHKPKLRSDIEDGVKIDLDRTPSLWINGQRVQNLGEATIVSIIDSILKK